MRVSLMASVKGYLDIYFMLCIHLTWNRTQSYDFTISVPSQYWPIVTEHICSTWCITAQSLLCPTVDCSLLRPSKYTWAWEKKISKMPALWLYPRSFKLAFQLEKYLVLLFLNMCMCMRVQVLTEVRGVRSLGSWVVDDCELPDVGAGNQTVLGTELGQGSRQCS